MLIWYIILKYCLIFKSILENLVLYKKNHHANGIISGASNNYGSQVLLINRGGGGLITVCYCVPLCTTNVYYCIKICL